MSVHFLETSSLIDKFKKSVKIVLWQSAVLVLLNGMTGTVYAGARPGSIDAACDSIALKFRSIESRMSVRELNFMLFDAASHGCLELTTTLLEHGASVHARDRFGNTALLIAARMGHTEVLDLLLERGSELRQVNLVGSSALLRAATMGRRKMVKRLLDLGVDANVANKKDMTALIAASYEGKARIVTLLLEHGADPNMQDSTGKGPVVYAAGKGYLKIMKLLMETDKLDINQSYGYNLTALMWAAGHSNDVPVKQGLACVEFLLDSGANIGAVDDRGRSALLIASQRGHSAIVSVLLERGASNHKDLAGKDAIALAANEEVRVLLQTHLNSQ